jgi:hypothetical protein
MHQIELNSKSGAFGSFEKKFGWMLKFFAQTNAKTMEKAVYPK